MDNLVTKTLEKSIFFAIPKIGQIALACRDTGNIKTFIETGTLGGATSCWASQHFDNVYTIEKHAGFQEGNIGRLGHIPNVRFLTGDSRTVLAEVLAKVGPSLLWLDAHFVGDYEYGRRTKDECPLREELSAVVASKESHFVFIDDAHFFTGHANLELDVAQWPNLNEIKNTLSKWDVILAREWSVILAIPKGNTQLLKIIKKIQGS